MTNFKLTDLSLRQLPFAKRQRRYFDAAMPNFGVTVGARTKTFFVVVGVNRKLRSIGQYPDVSLADARREAKRLAVQVPLEKPSISLTRAVESYLADCATRLRAGTVIEYQRHLRKHPDIPLGKLTKRTVEVSNAHQTIAWKVFANCKRCTNPTFRILS